MRRSFWIIAIFISMIFCGLSEVVTSHPQEDSSTDLQLKRSWSGKSPQDNIILLTYTNVRQEVDKIIADLTLVNAIGTWVYVEQDFTPSPTATLAVPRSANVYLLGPFANKGLGTIEFPKGSFLQLNAQSPVGLKGPALSPQNQMLLGAVAIDLIMRGLFNKELPSNAFDKPIVLPIEVGLASIDPLFNTITSHCSGPLGALGYAISQKDVEGAMHNIGNFILCTKKVKDKMVEWLLKYFTKEDAEKYVKWVSKELVDILDAPRRATVIALLTKFTFSAAPESWVRIEAVQTGGKSEYVKKEQKEKGITISKSQEHQNIFRITMKDGSTFTGNIVPSEVKFKTRYGEIGVKTDTIVSLSKGALILKDGSNLMGNFSSGNITIKTATAKFNFPAFEVVNLTTELMPIPSKEPSIPIQPPTPLRRLTRDEAKNGLRNLRIPIKWCIFGECPGKSVAIPIDPYKLHDEMETTRRMGKIEISRKGFCHIYHF